MKAEIISVGTELLLGHVVNSDAAHVARLLAELGISLQNAQVVGDNRERLLAALSLAASRADIIITTGGLGPTADDVTRFACAEFAGKPLHINQELAEELERFFGHAPAENQLRQAMTPADATIFPNPGGTAPGMAIPLDNGKMMILLPGPPGELAPMLENFVLPYLAKLSGGVILSRVVRVFGLGEGEVDERLSDLLDNSNPTVAPYFSGGEAFVKLTAREADREKAATLMEPIIEQALERLGKAAYGVDVANLEDVVVKALIAAKMSVATAESCTGGLLAKRLTDIPGSSAVFQLGLVAYSNEAKIRLLGVKPELLEKFGAVSEPVALEMARNAARLGNADFGIGITGIAGPDGATSEKPLGLVYIALQKPDGDFVYEMRPDGRYRGRNWVRGRATSHALYFLKDALEDISKIASNAR